MTFLREKFAPEMVTALARIDGRPVGVIANNTMVMAGAITAAAADKAARFLQPVSYTHLTLPTNREV